MGKCHTCPLGFECGTLRGALTILESEIARNEAEADDQELYRMLRDRLIAVRYGYPDAEHSAEMDPCILVRYPELVGRTTEQVIECYLRIVKRQRVAAGSGTGLRVPRS
jgi:hypothetical protein